MTTDTPQRIGLLGGSFNPPHEGHVYISEEAKRCLGLDVVWWVVAQQNPLKSKEHMASFDKRFALCEKLVQSNSSIIVSDIEKKQNIHYSYDLLEQLTTTETDKQFVWLMGEDSWHTFDQWYRWEDIMRSIPVAVLTRETGKDLEMCQASKAYASRRVDVRDLVFKPLPAWSYIAVEPHALSSTQLRNC